MKDIEVILEGFGETWKPGQHLLDVEVTLGQNEKSSNCTIMLSDPLGLIASALISHSIAMGGIQQLVSTNTITATSVASAPASTPTSSSITAVGDGSVGVVANGAKFTPQIKAFLDMVAVREVGGYFDYAMSSQWYYTAINNVRFTEAEAMRPNPPFARFPWTKAAGRYQIIPKTWDYIKERNPGQFTNFLPESQDRAAYFLMSYRGMVPYINAGDIQTAIRKGRNEWTSLPGAAEQQSGWTMEKALKYYNERLAVYQGSAVAVKPVEKVEPTTPTTNAATVQPTQEPVKGSKITINWDNNSYEFYHQGTEWNDKGVTTVQGQGLRWILNRRKRNKTVKNTTLKELAQTIASAHKVKLDWQATYDPTYEHIDQSGLTDYQLLVREANQAGLYVSEANGSITVKSRDKISDSNFIISRGQNLVKFKIEDKALDQTNEEVGSLLQDETKTTVEPLTGQLKVQTLDIDSVKSKDSTGKQATTIAGTPKPGQDAIMAQNRARMKRIKGLPSSFTITLDKETLALEPLKAVRTTGFKEPLNRVWMIDKVTHKASLQLTTLDVYSPVEVVDNTPTTVTEPTKTAETTTTTTTVASTGFVYPLSGTVTSGYKWRNGRMHNGVDISSVGGTGPGGNIVAVADGIVTTLSDPGGYGNYLKIQHDNGYNSLYGHLYAYKVASGQRVKKGQVIAIEGNTGGSRGTHLHFEIREPGGTRVNPTKHFPKLIEGKYVTGGSAV